MSSLTGPNPYKGSTGNIGDPTGMGNKVPRGYRQGQMQQFSPEQMQLFSQMFGHVGPDSFLSRLAGGDQSMFEQMEAPAMKQFGQLQSGIANRFSGMGSGARRSSGFQQAQTTAAQDFASQLQSQRMGLQQQALQDLMSMSGSLLQQRPYEQFLVPKSQSFLKQLGVAGAQGLGQAAGMAMMA